MREPLLIIDVSFLCHRAWHSLGALTFGNDGTGSIFGVLRDIVQLQEAFFTSRIAFCFDSGPSHRRKLLPSYKGSRSKRYAEETPIEREARKGFRKQIDLLRTDYLHRAGFRNVFYAKGFEADDIIAKIAEDTHRNDEAIIVGSDHDFWQCLRQNVYCWNPITQSAYTIKSFREDWGLEPTDWAKVKAYAGCSSDDVPGIAGVGEKTAAKYLRGELGEHTQAAKKLTVADDLLVRNMALVCLPYHGTPAFDVVPDEVTEERWQALVDSLGMQALRDIIPRNAIRKSKGRKRGKETKKGFGLCS